MHEATLKLMESKLGLDHPSTVTSRNNLAACYHAAGRIAEAGWLLASVVASQQRTLSVADPILAGSLAALGSNLLQQRKCAEAEPILRECLKIREAKLPDDWLRFNAESLLADSLRGQKKYAEAEPLLLSGYEGMKAREAKIPADGKVRLTQAGTRILQLYVDWGKLEKAAEWRTRLGLAPELPADPFAP
jgi:hypothetical protein